MYSDKFINFSHELKCSRNWYIKMFKFLYFFIAGCNHFVVFDIWLTYLSWLMSFWNALLKTHFRHFSAWCIFLKKLLSIFCIIIWIDKVTHSLKETWWYHNANIVLLEIKFLFHSALNPTSLLQTCALNKSNLKLW